MRERKRMLLSLLVSYCLEGCCLLLFACWDLFILCDVFLPGHLALEAANYGWKPLKTVSQLNLFSFNIRYHIFFLCNEISNYKTYTIMYILCSFNYAKKELTRIYLVSQKIHKLPFITEIFWYLLCTAFCDEQRSIP